VFGGRRRQLVMQYLIESILLTLLAAILSVLFYGIFRSLFNEVLNTALQPVNGFRLREVILLGLLVLIVGTLAGIYPAVILSGSEVISSVKGKLGSVEKGRLMRKSLLVLQFTIAIGVFIFSMTLSRQIKYFFDKDLGYNKDRLMVITAFPKQWDSVGIAKIESIRDGLLRSSAIKDATVSFDLPEKTPPNELQVSPEGNHNDLPVSLQTITVDEKYASTFGIQLLAGRFFSDQIGGFVTGDVVINESAMKRFGWESAVGKKIKIPNGGGELNVVGVVKDFHLASLHELIEPLLLFHVKDGSAYRFLTVKLQAGNLSKSVEMVRARWKELSPTAPFEFVFMDEKLQTMYQLELQLKKAAGIASGLMLLIVLLGIFGVLTLALTKRTKEIAVRKVLGAELHNIISLVIKEFAGLIVVANLIAWPLAYYFTNQWLRQFAYRIIPPASIYLIAGSFVTIIAFALISIQSLKVAMANPVKSLKTE
jgi:ABC-type antimicrobial peptide transport system permease subunit